MIPPPTLIQIKWNKRVEAIKIRFYISMETVDMNSVSYKVCLSHNDEESRAIEAAVRSAVRTLVQVINDINLVRAENYKRVVAEKDKENAVLKAEIDKAEKELAFLRQRVVSQQDQGAYSRYLENEPCFGTRAVDWREGEAMDRVPIDLNDSTNHNTDVHLEAMIEETSAVQEDTGAKLSDQPGLFNMPSHYPESSIDASSCNSSHVLKAESSNVGAVYIKFEVKEESHDFEEPFDSSSHVRRRGAAENGSLISNTASAIGSRHSPACLHISSLRRRRGQLASLKSKDAERQQRYRERIRADPVRRQAYLEKDRHRYHVGKKLIHELPEQVQRQKRAAWREAARRCRARKRSHPSIWAEPL